MYNCNGKKKGECFYVCIENGFMLNIGLLDLIDLDVKVVIVIFKVWVGVGMFE